MWRTVATSNKGLIDGLIKNSVFSSARVKDAMLKTDRGHYSRNMSEAFNDTPHLIGHGVTISAPHMHAMAMELLESRIQPSSKVLDVGSGSGYLVACFSRMGAETVLGIEIIPQLVEWSLQNLAKDDPDLLSSGKVDIRQGDGWKGIGELEYDAIHVGAAASEVPEALKRALKKGGRMVIPVGEQNEDQYLMMLDKDQEGNFRESRITGVRYVPLVRNGKTE